MARRLEDLPLSYEELRSLVLEALKSIEKGTQFVGFYSLVGKTAVDRGFAKDQQNVIGYLEHPLSNKDEARVQNIVWDLIVEGVIRPGLGDGMNPDLPFFHLTDYGLKIVKDVPQSPYDPDGYLCRLRSDVPEIDPVILIYLEESLHTFRIGCLLSSTVALGCASEKALLLLIGKYADSLPASMQAKFRKNTEGHLVKRQFDEFTKMLGSHLMHHMPGDVKDGLEVALLGVFSMIRTYRNEAGHPTGKVIAREQCYANIMVFPTYLKRVYALITWLASKPF